MNPGSEQFRADREELLPRGKETHDDSFESRLEFSLGPVRASEAFKVDDFLLSFLPLSCTRIHVESTHLWGVNFLKREVVY
mmetsp:Transcript_926/g.2160  ORF Transcript_926/g.2160 Transcript_926/m.2160 type:complete len:81 (-) Transcript_926:600-842(-)